MLDGLRGSRRGGAKDSEHPRVHPGAPDTDLLDSGAAGFDLFYRRYHDYLLRDVARRVNDIEGALDLTSEILAAAYLGRRRFDARRGSGAAWLTGIARHKIADYAREQCAVIEARRRVGVECRPASDAALAEAEALIAATDWVSVLAAPQAGAIWQRHVLDRSYADIAADEGISQATVRKRVGIGLARLSAQVQA